MNTNKQKNLYKKFWGWSAVAAILLILALTGAWLWRSPRKPAVTPTGDHALGNYASGDYASTIGYAKSRIQKIMQQKHLPSIAVALIDDQTVIWQRAYGVENLEQGTPATVDTIYKLWSVAKAFTAIETMRLVQDGLVDLDAPLTAYLPDFSINTRFADSAPITVRSLLTHRAGLPRNECHWIGLSPEVLSDLTRSVADCQAVYPVGYRYKYSNIGFDVLGHLIEKQRGAPFADDMVENLLAPIGMENSAFLRAHLPPQREVAPGYEYYKGEYYPYPQEDITSLPSGNLYASLGDMAQFIKFIFRGGEAGGEPLIESYVLESMFETQTSRVEDPQPMGLGWKTATVLGSEHMVWHDGGPMDGTGALAAFLPERKLGIVLIANGTSFESSVSMAFALDLLEQMREVKFGLTTPEQRPAQEQQVAANDWASYTGTYFVFNEPMEVFIRSGRLKAKLYGLTFNLAPSGVNSFKPRHWLADLGLIRLLGSPVDLSQLEITFIPGDEVAGEALLLNIANLSYEFWPRYPDGASSLMDWDDLIGEYNLVARLPDGSPGQEILGQTSIEVVDGVLRMAGAAGPLYPVSESELLVLGSPFTGEIMVYDPETGNITHQMIAYVKQRQVVNQE